MRNYITLNGKNSNEINGLLIQELPPISKPQIRTEVEEIDGRDGDIVTKLGFAAYDKEFTVGLYKDFDINAIIAYFNSEGTVVFSNEPDKYYNYQIIDQIDFERLVRYRTATVRMHCQPFKYSNTEGARTLGNKGTASGEGSFITLDNTPEAQFSKIEPKGNVEQTTYSGKNLLNSYIATKPNWQSGSLVVNADGSFTVSENTGSNNYFQLAQTLGTLCSNLQVGDEAYLFLETTSNVKNIYIGEVWENGAKKTITQAMLDRSVVIYGGYNQNDTIKIMVTRALETAYEPYVGGTASPSPEYPQDIQVVTGGNTVKITGKNLCYNANRVSATTLEFFCDCASITDTSAVLSFITDFSTPSATVYSFVDGVDLHTGVGNITITANQQSSKTLDFTNIMSQIRAGKTLRLMVYRGGASFAALTEPMLELGSNATAYEPYKAQEFEVNLGKNLLEITESASTVADVSITPNGDGTFTLNGTASASSWKNIARDYTNPAFSIGEISSTTKSQTLDGLTLSATLSNGTLQTVSHNTSNGWWAIRLKQGETYNNAILKIQLEKGSTATAYAPYFTPIELARIPNTDYEDKPIKIGDTWYIHRVIKKLTMTSSVSHSVRFDETNTTRVNLTLPVVDAPAVAGGKATHFPYNSNAWYNDVVGWGDNATNRAFFFRALKTTIGEDAASVNAWLDANAPVFYYPLANPVDEEITNETLISQLEALYNQAHAYKGRTHVAAIAQGSNAPHIIEAEVQRSSDGNITNNGNIVSKPTLTIYGSGNIGVSLNGYQILEITLGDEEYITIDTAAMEAYKDTLDNLKNRLVNGDYSKFALRPGSNMIEFSGTVSKCVISKYSRWL